MSSLISSLVVRISAEGAAACPRPASGWVGPSLLVSGLMLAWPLCGLAQPQTPPQAPPTVSVRVAPGMAAAEEMLSLPAFLQRARQSNKSVAARRSEAEIASTAVQRAQGAFETQATLSSSVGATRQANTKEEELIRRGGIYDRESADLSATVSRLLGTGTRIEGKATLSRFLTNVSNDQEYRTYFGVNADPPAGARLWPGGSPGESEGGRGRGGGCAGCGPRYGRKHGCRVDIRVLGSGPGAASCGARR